MGITSQMIISVREEIFDDSTVKKDDLSKYFNMKIKELNSKFGIVLTKKDIASKLNISYELFRKIINREKPTKKRDCIIAVCALLGLDTEDSNKALRFNNMLKLDDRGGRDEIIMTILDNHRRHYTDNDELDYDPDIISEIDQVLADNAYPQLDIINHRKKPTDNDEKEKKYPYKLVKKMCEDYSIQEYRFVLRTETLNSSEIDLNINDASVFSGNHISAYMIFDNNGEQISIHLDVSVDYRFDNEYYFVEKGNGLTKEYKVYRRIEDSGEFRSSFEELREYAYNELRNSDAVFNDTKNFIYRACTVVRDGDLHLYIEIFNFDIPQFNEYYLLDYCNGKYDMTVSNSSRLMRVLLPPEVYKKKYGNAADKIIAEYDHENDKFRVLSNSGIDSNSQDSYLNSWREDYYRMLKKQVESHISEIRKSPILTTQRYLEKPELENRFRDKAQERSHGVFHLKYDPLDLIPYFHAEDAFNCIWGPNEKIIGYYKKYLELINNSLDVDDDFDFETARSAFNHTYDVFYKCRLKLKDKYGYTYNKQKYDLNEEYNNMKEFITNNSINDLEEDIDSEYNKIRKYVDMGFKNSADVWYAAKKYGLKQGKSIEEIDLEMAKYGKKALEKIIGVKNPEPVFTLSDGRQVKLTVNDLLDGANLGITSIDEIGKVILKHGTLEVSKLL